MSNEGRGRAVSLRAELLELARREGEDFQAMLHRYATERLVYRLAQTQWADRFVLKGAWLFAAWQITRRSTRDIDFLASGEATPHRLEEIFREAAEASVEDDGIRYFGDQIQVELTRKGAPYPGARIRIPGDLSGARFVVRIDLGFGDAVVVDPLVVRLPTLLDLPAPEVRAYSPEVAIAEKAEALVRFGSRNSRYNDFYDIAILATEKVIDGGELADQLSATFTRRGTEIPERLPSGLQDEFAASEERQREWRAFKVRSEASEDLSLAETVQKVRALLWPVLNSLRSGQRMRGEWRPGSGWTER